MTILVAVAVVDFFSLGVVLTTFGPLFLTKDGIFSYLEPHRVRLYWLGVAFAMAPLGQLLSTSVIGALSDLYGRKKLLLITLLGTCLSILTCAYAIISQWLLLLLVGRFLTGLFAGNIAIAQASLADMTQEQQSKPWRFNFLQIGIGLGMLLGPLFGGKLITPYHPINFAKPFALSCLLTLIMLLILFFFYRETNKKQGSFTKLLQFDWLAGPKQIYYVFQAKRVRNLLLAWFVFMLGWDFYVQFFTNFLQGSELSFSSSEVGSLFAYLGIAYLFVQIGIVQPSTRFFAAKSMIVPASLSVACFLFLMGLSSNKVFLYSMLTFYLISIGLFIPNFNAILSDRSATEYQGASFGMAVALHALSTIIMSLVGGVLLVYSVRLPLLGGGSLILLSSLIFIMLTRQNFRKTVNN